MKLKQKTSPGKYQRANIITTHDNLYKAAAVLNNYRSESETKEVIMLDGIERTSLQTIKKIGVIRELMNQTFERVKIYLPRLRQAKEIKVNGR